MAAPDADALIRTLRRQPLLAPARCLPPVQTLIPHRPPALRITGLTGFDPATATVTGNWACTPADPAFDGHFPDAPVLPASVQTEAMAQTGACLLALIRGRPCGQVSLTRCHRAEFLRPVLPGTALTLTARLLQADSMLALFGAQVLVGTVIHAAAVLEAHLHD